MTGHLRKRVALVVGNGSYASSPLKNPANDAHVMAVSLRRLGFEVEEKTNLGYVEMNKAVEAFGKRLRTGGIGLFYYAGHGMQVHGVNYLIPVDAQIEDENEVRYKAVDAGLVLAKMEQAKSDVNIVVLDACRDNPFSRSFRSASHGLASMDAPNGTFIAYATAPGKTAADGDGKNGLYTAELVKVLDTPGIPVEQVFKRALKAVREKSGSKQTPWVASNLEGEFYFVQPSSMTVTPPSQALPQPIPAELVKPRLNEPLAVPMPNYANNPPTRKSPQGDTLWITQRIPSAQVALAPGRTSAEGREFLVAASHGLRLYRQEKSLKLLAEVEFSSGEKVLAIDSDGNSRVYVTVMNGHALESKIFSYQNDKLQLVSDKLPYFFRALALNGANPKIYAQQQGGEEVFYGNLYEVYEASGKMELRHPIQLPRHANIFNYNRVAGPDGRSYAVAISISGYLVVYSEAGDELWRSSEKFGGSEAFLQGGAGGNAVIPMGQRITVTQGGEIIVPQNSGLFVLGNIRWYSQSALISFSWNGSSLEELWRTKQKNYLPDYYYDAESREIALLEVVKKAGLAESVIRLIQTH